MNYFMLHLISVVTVAYFCHLAEATPAQPNVNVRNAAQQLPDIRKLFTAVADLGNIRLPNINSLVAKLPFLNQLKQLSKLWTPRVCHPTRLVGIAWPTPDIPDGNRTEVLTAEACCALCRQAFECTHWTWHITARRCNLKAGRGDGHGVKMLSTISGALRIYGLFGTIDFDQEGKLF